MGYCSFSAAVPSGNTPLMAWLCQRGEDIYRVEDLGRGPLLLATLAREPQAALWLFQRGFRLTKRDIEYVFPNPRAPVMSMIFKMTSKIHRASLFHASSLEQKLWLLLELQHSDNVDLSEEEADANFARFNQYNDKTLEHKSLLAVARIIGRSGTLKARLDAIDNLPISSDSKGDLRELVGINLA